MNYFKLIISKNIRNKSLYKFWLFLHKVSSYGLNFGVASGYADYSGELFIIKKAQKYFSNSPIVLDVGASIGDWSKFMLQELKSQDFKLFMIEPLKDSFNDLENKFYMNKRVKLRHLGFSNNNESATIFFNQEKEGSASILKKNSNFSEEISLITLDDFSRQEKISEIDFLKMDVQGFEYKILQGAKSLLQGDKIKFIQFEFDEPNIEARVFFKDFWNLLSPKYDIYHSLYNGLVKIDEYDYTLENYRCMNYLAVSKKIKFS